MRSMMIAWTSLSLLCGGCFPGYLRLDISAPAEVNHGLPLHVLVRAVETEQFRRESYTEVSRALGQKDPALLRDVVVNARPGQPFARTLWLKRPDKKAVGLYCLFTVPTGSWKLLLEAPLPYRYNLILEENHIRPTPSQTLTVPLLPGL